MEEETRKSVIRDILTRKLPVAIKQDERIREEVADLAIIHQRMRKEMSAMQSKMIDIRASLRKFVTDYFADLIIQSRRAGMETYAAFFERASW